MLGCKQLEELKLVSKIVLDSYIEDRDEHGFAVSDIQRSHRNHYGDLSLSALLHFVYSTKSLRKLSLICFYGADTIKFNALISAIKRKNAIQCLEIAQLRKDNDTLFSLSKLFKPNNRKKNKVSWDYYDSVTVSFGVEFGHFYHGSPLNTNDLKKFVELILKNQAMLQQSKLNLLSLVSTKINSNFEKLFMPNDVLWIVVEYSLGLDCLNVCLLQWNLSDSQELVLLFE